MQRKYSLTSASVDGRRTESLPHDGLTDVCGNEEGNTARKQGQVLNKRVFNPMSQSAQPTEWCLCFTLLVANGNTAGLY